MAFELGNVVKHEWLVRFSDDVKARPRELSVVKRIIALRPGADQSSKAAFGTSAFAKTCDFFC